jgi:hypothetical protein
VFSGQCWCSMAQTPAYDFDEAVAFVASGKTGDVQAALSAQNVPTEDEYLVVAQALSIAEGETKEALLRFLNNLLP